MSSNKEGAVNRKEKILLAAERLFATRGYHGVAIRDIAEEAEVQFALVGYYYGSKQALYEHIFHVRSGYIQERLELLAKVRANATPRRALHDIVSAFVGPVLKVAADPNGQNFLRLLSRGMTDQLAEDEEVIRELFDPLAHAFIDALAAVQPHATRGTVAWCYQFALGALLHHVTDRRIERLSRGENRIGDYQQTEPLLVKFLVHGIRGACAPAVAEPEAKADTKADARPPAKAGKAAVKPEPVQAPQPELKPVAKASSKASSKVATKAVTKAVTKAAADKPAADKPAAGLSTRRRAAGA